MVYKEAGINRKSKRVPTELNPKNFGADAEMLEHQRQRTHRLRQLLEILGFDTSTKSMKDIHNNFLLMNDSDVRQVGLIGFADFCAWYDCAILQYVYHLFCFLSALQ